MSVSDLDKRVWAYQQFRERSYWLNKLSDIESVSCIPFDKRENRVNSGHVCKYDAYNIKFSTEISEPIRKLSRGNKERLHVMLTSGIFLLLQAYTGNKDTVIGIPIKNESYTKNVINTILPIYIEISKSLSVRSFLSNIRNSIIEATSNQNYPIDILIKQIGKFNNRNQGSLFDVVVMLNDFHHSESIADFNCGLIFNFNNDGLNIDCNINYDSFSYSLDLIERISRNLVHIFEQIFCYDLNRSLKEVTSLSFEEQKLIIQQFNDTITEFPKVKLIPQLFEEQVARTPNSVAVILEDKKITYKELFEKSSNVVSDLCKKGIKPNDIVSILCNTSIEMIIAILGVLRAGSAYLPIDISNPVERINFILKDSNSKYLITDRLTIKELELPSERIINVNKIIKTELPAEGINCKGNNEWLTSIAYIMYTSGTTGVPKGILIEHKSFLEFNLWAIKEFGHKKNFQVLLSNSYASDGAIQQIFPPLISGGTLHLIKKELRLDISSYVNYLRNNHINNIDEVPVVMKEIFNIIELDSNREILPDLSHLSLGSEYIPIEIVKNSRKYLNWNGKIINAYGPAEASVEATTYHFSGKSDNEISLIGKPRSNTRIFITNKYNELCPIGVPGEICIAGEGLARGYLNKVELTHSKFIVNKLAGSMNDLLYKTGDQGCWLPDGNIEFLGRIDHQVKIRGFRVELGEIEKILNKIQGIRESVVIDFDDKKGQKYIVVYYISDTDSENLNIRNKLSKSLPDYMIPSFFVQIDTIPLNANGKVNRKLLPEPELDAVGCKLPANDNEEKMVEVWSEVLGIPKDKISTDANFFELGGDSIKTIQIASRLNRYGLKLSVADIFKYQKIDQISKKILKCEREISQSPVTGKIPLIPIQSWLLNTGFMDLHHYNQSVMLYKKEGFDLPIINNVFKELVEHHDILRAIFYKRNNEYFQYNNGLENKNYSIETFNLKGENEVSSFIEKQTNIIQRSINLEKGPLVKLGHFITNEGDHLLLVIHHLIIDGISWRILLEDFSIAYSSILKDEKPIFPLKTDSYKYWSERLNDYSKSSKLLKEKLYWQKVVAREIPNIPKDFNVKGDCKNIGNQIIKTVSFNKSQTGQILKKSNKAYNTEINDILLSALVKSVCKWGNLSKIAVELEGHGREAIFDDVDINRTIGWFTTQYPIVLENYEDVSELIKETKENLRHIPFKGIGYGILKYSNDENNELFNLKPEICFNYLGEFTGSGISSFEEEELYSFSKYSAGDSISHLMESVYAIEVNGMASGGQLSFTFRYNKHEYNENTIEKLTNQFKQSLIEITEHCRLKENNELTPSDFGLKNITLNDFNRLVSVNRNNIQDIYELSPMQYGMLFHSLVDRHSGEYFEQSEIIIEGDIDCKILEKSFNEVLNRYETLRTKFVYEDIDRPLQIVLTKREVKINFKDIRNLDNVEQQKSIETYKTEERHKGFDLNSDNLTKLTLFKTEDQKFTFIWSFHHILMDGWCTTILFRDLLTFYRNVKYGASYKMPPTNKFRNYITWLQSQDNDKSLDFWKKYLQNFNGANSLPKKIKEEPEFKKGKLTLKLEDSVKQRLIQFASRNAVTPNVLLQTVWGLILQLYNDTDDVIFGSVTSGRPSEIENVEEMVGLFINTVPIRIKRNETDTFNTLLDRIKNETLEIKKYEYSSLADIQSFTDKGIELIDHVFLFQNFAINDGFKELNKSSTHIDVGFKVQKVHNEEQTNYNFNIIISPREEFEIITVYNKNLFDDELISNVLNHFRNILEYVVVNPNELLDNQNSMLEIGLTQADSDSFINELSDFAI